MKIAHVCQFIGIGGLEKVLLDLSSQQLKDGHKVSLFVYDHDQRWVKKFEDIGVQVENDYLKSNGYDRKLIQRIKAFTRDKDIVHTHDLNPILYAGIAKYLGGKRRLIHTTHGMEHIKLFPKTRLYEGFLGFVSDEIICVSETFAKYYKSQPFTKSSKVHVIPNGVSTLGLYSEKNKMKELICKEFNLDPSRTLGICVGRVSSMKGQLELIKEFNKNGEQIILVGPATEKDYFQECVKRARNNIVLTGARDDIKRLLTGSDYFISASKHEGMPIAVLEAAALGLPCFLSKIEGHTFFNKGETRVLTFTSPEEIDIKEELNSLTTSMIARNFQKYVCENYSIKKMADDYQKVYLGFSC